MSEAIHGDLSARARQDTTKLRWTPSPSGSVWRKRVLVLEGVFSDEHGDWPAGTPRQFPGRERRHVVVDTHALAWTASDTPGVTHKPLTLYCVIGSVPPSSVSVTPSGM